MLHCTLRTLQLLLINTFLAFHCNAFGVLPLTKMSMQVSGVHTLPKAVIFDVDGTLCDSFMLGYSATNTVLKRNGFQATTEDEYHQGTRYSTPERLARHVGMCPLKDRESFWETGSRMGKEFDDLYIGLVDTSTAPLFDGIEQLISDCAKVTKVGALSNAAVAYVNKVLDTHKFTPWFSVAHGADDVPAPKPAPDGLLQCCRDLQQDPSSALYVGDSPTDGLAARAAGMRSIGVTWGSHRRETLVPAFDIVVDSVADLRREIMGEVLLGEEQG